MLLPAFETSWTSCVFFSVFSLCSRSLLVFALSDSMCMLLHHMLMPCSRAPSPSTQHNQRDDVGKKGFQRELVYDMWRDKNIYMKNGNDDVQTKQTKIQTIGQWIKGVERYLFSGSTMRLDSLALGRKTWTIELKPFFFRRLLVRILLSLSPPTIS